MVDLSAFPIFQNNKVSLKAASKDDHDGTAAYMTESLFEVINFDAVKDEAIKGLRLIENPKSNDALFSYADGRLAFIEFKNGFMDFKKQFDVRKKIYDSLLLFCDIVKIGISETRKEMDYILVYNESKNPDSEMNQKSFVSTSKSRDEIAGKLMELGNKTYIKYGLDIFRTYCFKEVYTYTAQEFQDNFVQKHTRT